MFEKIDFYKELQLYKKRCEKNEIFKVDKDKLYPILRDRKKEAGDVDEHYFLQDIYMASKVLEETSRKLGVFGRFEGGKTVHYDIGSRIDGFIAHLLANKQVLNKIILLDIRPFPHDINGLYFLQADATNLDTIKDNTIMSISALHSIEHFGLGRYGDKIDPNGWRYALNAIQNKMCSEGIFYLSVPIGPQDVLCFNAHRIFNPYTIVNTMDKCELISFAYLQDMCIEETSLERAIEEIKEYDLGLFIFRKM